MNFPEDDDATFVYPAYPTWPPMPASHPVTSPMNHYRQPPVRLRFQPAPPKPPKRKLSGWTWLGIVVAGLAVLLGAATAVVVVAGYEPGPNMFRDRGVRACEAIAAVKAGRTVNTAGLGEGSDGLAVLRDAFAHSRYDDLKTAGTQAMDLVRQFKGSDAAGLAFVAGGQLVEKWSALSGACSAHGVQIPALGEIGK